MIPPLHILDVYSADCPRCAARPNDRCRFDNGKVRQSAHRERVDAAQEAADLEEARESAP